MDPLKEALHYILADERGKRFIWHVIKTSGYFDLSYTGNAETYFREGKRHIGKEILDMVADVSPLVLAEMYTLDMKERNKSKREYEQKRMKEAMLCH